MSTDGRSTAARTEPRWPLALAALVLIALPFLLPEHLTVGPSWLLPTYVGLTNATAFSPTDAIPLAQWAKLTMGLQAVISMVVLSLVIARAVNVLG
jgi:hypothetical protein